MALREGWVPGLSAVGPEEACDCSEALTGFALSPVPTGGEIGHLLDEGFEPLVCYMYLPTPWNLQDPSLSQGTALLSV